MLRRATVLSVFAAVGVATPAWGAGWVPPITLPSAAAPSASDTHARISPSGNIVVSSEGSVWIRPAGGPVGGELSTGLGSNGLFDAAINDDGLVVAARVNTTTNTLSIARRAAGASAFTTVLPSASSVTGTPYVAVFADGTSVVLAIQSGALTAFAFTPAGTPDGAASGTIPVGAALKVATGFAADYTPEGDFVVLVATDEDQGAGDHVDEVRIARRLSGFWASQAIDSLFTSAGQSAEFRPVPPSIAIDGTVALGYLLEFAGPGASDDFVSTNVASLADGAVTGSAPTALETRTGLTGVGVPGGTFAGLSVVGTPGRTTTAMSTVLSAGVDPTLSTVKNYRRYSTGAPIQISGQTVAANDNRPMASGGASLRNSSLLILNGRPTSVGTTEWRTIADSELESDALPVFGPGEATSISGAPAPGDNLRGDAVLAVGDSALGARRLAIWDGTGPTIGTVSPTPATPEAGQGATLTTSASDALSALQLSWDLGDGTTASGRTVTHTWATPGTKQVRLTVTDQAGQTATQTTSLTVAPDTTKPVVSQLKVPAKVKRSAAIVSRFSLSEQAKVVVVVERVLTGRGKPCKIGRTTGKRCTIYKRAIRVAPSALRSAGPVQLTLRAKTAKRLAAGAYRVTVTATDAAGNASAPVRAKLTVR